MARSRKRRSDSRHIVYVITNEVTNENYIGITVGHTKKTLRARIQKHVWRALNESKGWAICDSIINHGVEAHKYGILAIIRGKIEAHAVERDLISKYLPVLNSTGIRNLI